MANGSTWRRIVHRTTLHDPPRGLAGTESGASGCSKWARAIRGSRRPFSGVTPGVARVDARRLDRELEMRPARILAVEVAKCRCTR